MQKDKDDGLLNIGVVYLCFKNLTQRLFLCLACGMAPSANAQEPSPVGSMAEFCKGLPRAAYQEFERREHPNDWFELYTVARGVTAIYEPHQWQEVISYLIEGEASALLFDTGNGIGDLKKVVDDLTDKPVTVLNSHSHYDHVGGNFAFANIAGLNTDFTRDRQKGHVNKEIRIEVSKQALCRPLPTKVTEENHVGRPYVVSKFIEDGHVFDLGGRRLEVIHVPGHTPDAIALIDRQAGLMWTGDSYYSGPIWLYAPETDLDAYAASLDRLIAEVPTLKMLLPAHNTPSVDPIVLLNVQRGFNSLRAGELTASKSTDGTVVYRIDGEDEFSFLLRDGMLEED